MFRDETFNAIEQADAAGAAVELMMDEETFRAFYERNASALWGYLVRITGNRQSADDLLQETFYRFLRANAAHESEAHRRNSLFRIATNLARDARRRAAVRPLFGIGGSDIDRMRSSDDSAGTERAANVNQALARLKPNERAMLWMAYAEGASHPEIANALGVSPGSIKMLLFRARRRMAAILRGEK